MNSHNRTARVTTIQTGDRGLQRLQFELALDMSTADSRPPAETLAHAARAAGADLVVVLPKPSGSDVTAVIRLVDEGRDYFLQVGSSEAGFAVSDEADMDKTLLGLARASVDVLQRLAEDRDLIAPLAAGAH